MKVLLLILGVSLTFNHFSQNQSLKQKEIQVISEKEVKVRNISIGAFGGVSKFFGEETADLSLDYGFVLKSHINNKFDLDYNLHFGETKYNIPSLDIKESVSYFGANVLFNVNLIETFKNKKTYSKVSPFIGVGAGLLSSTPLNQSKKYIFLNFPISLGVNFNISPRFVVGLNATGRMLLSDDWDNSRTNSANDFLFNPAISLKYVVGRKKQIKREYVTKVIEYNENHNDRAKDYEIFEEKQIESFVEISVRDLKDSTGVSLIKKEEVLKPVSQDYLFYTIQVASFNSSQHDIDELTDVKIDFKFFNPKLRRYNYCKGFYSTTREAQADLKRIKIKNPDAFITAIYKREKIKVYKARNMLNSGEVIVNLKAAQIDYSK